VKISQVGNDRLQTETSIVEKFTWRAKYFANKINKMDLDALFLCLQGAKKRTGPPLIRLLEKRDLVNWDNPNIFVCEDATYHFQGAPPVTDLIYIALAEKEYIRKNFVDNEVYLCDDPYFTGEVKLSAGDVVIDAGANFGMFSTVASRAVGKSGKVYSFEPIEKAQKILASNIEVNNLENVTVVDRALGAKSGPVSFSVFESLEASSGFYQEEGAPTITVQQTSLDEFVEDHNIKKLDFVKADIEGMERELLKGAEKTLKHFRPKLSLCTYHRHDDPEVLDTMVRELNCGYTIRHSKSKLYAY
jgi:FkbM family methyltransferase